MFIIPFKIFQKPKNTCKKLSCLYTLVKQVATIQKDSIVPKHGNYLVLWVKKKPNKIQTSNKYLQVQAKTNKIGRTIYLFSPSNICPSMKCI